MKYDKETEEFLKKELDTRDKAYMFFKIKFPTIVPRLDLEGSPSNRAWNILSEMEKQDLLNELKNELNKIFG